MHHPNAHTLELIDRPKDRWFIVGFVMFACTSVFVDRLAAHDVDFCGEQRMWGALCWYGRNLDPLFLANPQWLRVMSGISAYVFAPMYLLLAWAFWRGVDAIRLPGIAWAIAMIYSMVVHLWMEFLGDHPPPNPFLLMGVYLPYLIMPFALLWRLRSPAPFTAT